MALILWQAFSSASLSVSEAASLEHRTGRALLREGLKSCFGLDFSPEELETALVTDPVTGKPSLPRGGPAFNISHTDGMAVCAFDICPVGVDAERTGYFPEILVKKALTEEERRQLEAHGTTEELRNEWFYRFWTLKEAYGKRSGEGVDRDLKAVSFEIGDRDLKAVSFGNGDCGLRAESIGYWDHEGNGSPGASDERAAFARPVSCTDPAVHLRQYTLPGDCIVSVCTDAGRPGPDILLHCVGFSGRNECDGCLLKRACEKQTENAGET